jgi:hypothetical protein
LGGCRDTLHLDCAGRAVVFILLIFNDIFNMARDVLLALRMAVTNSPGNQTKYLGAENETV